MTLAPDVAGAGWLCGLGLGLLALVLLSWLLCEWAARVRCPRCRGGRLSPDGCPWADPRVRGCSRCGIYRYVD